VNQNTPELSKAYEHREVEARWYRTWTERGYFHADAADRIRPPFCIVLPPPNVTGSLHLGHALTATLQDILCRWKRMSGFNVLWLPGTDHAGIATQMIVEKDLQKTEKKSRHDLGRAEFLRRVWLWKEKYGSRIGEQHQALGASLDWKRERFTMDQGLSRAVREVFVRLHEEGLIYREKKLINWCPRCHTALSDLEVTFEEQHQGELWSFAYPLADGSGEIVMATTRPETMLGDTAVAVHPDDPRYRHLVGKMVRHPLVDREFPIVADAILVDPKFGTGAVKVTPAHDFNDFEVGKRHGLPMISVVGPEGKMTAEAGPFAGLDRYEARKQVKQAIAEKGLERGTQPHLMPLGRCQRCETVLEPLLSNQWFVKIEPLAREAIEAVEQGKTRFIPEQWTNTYMGWMRQIHDWCISRQLWWGHQIPAWYCTEGHATVAREEPETCVVCGRQDLVQDEDVLDTWFSSALWPFSTLGWPDDTADLQTYYPTSVMETGHDIIFFWVARMMMMGIHFMKDVPFRVVYLHPMVRDEKGHKMSKTKGNVIDPLVITEQYGADALRFTLAALTAQGRDIKLAKERIEGYRGFANKLWNASRFTFMNLAGFQWTAENVVAQARTPADHWILARLARAVNETIDALEAYRFNDAASTVYQFVWHELCDWYIELSKEALYGGDAQRETAAGAPGSASPQAAELKRGAQAVLTHCLDVSLRLLHPMMPFITEQLWQTLKSAVGASGWADSIMVAPYPSRSPIDEAVERGFGPVIGIIDAMRNIRGEMNIPFKTPLTGTHAGSLGPEALEIVRQEQARIERLANAPGLTVSPGPTPRLATSAVVVGAGFEVRVPLAGVVDMATETARIQKEMAKLDGDLAGIEKKLANPSFVERAPAEVVEKDRARASELQAKKRKLEAHLALLSGKGEEAAPVVTPAPDTAVPQTPIAVKSRAGARPPPPAKKKSAKSKAGARSPLSAKRKPAKSRAGARPRPLVKKKPAKRRAGSRPPLTKRKPAKGRAGARPPPSAGRKTSARPSGRKGRRR
jgi:valyl-tRNA synthetase